MHALSENVHVYELHLEMLAQHITRMQIYANCYNLVMAAQF